MSFGKSFQISFSHDLKKYSNKLRLNLVLQQSTELIHKKGKTGDELSYVRGVCEFYGQAKGCKAG